MTEERFQALGAELRKARESRTRSLDDIAAQTKINRRHLEAIEAGDFSRLPQGPYVKAFVREFSRAVGVPVPDEFALQPGTANGSSKDPKVVSHSIGERAESLAAPITEVARETARIADQVVRTAVKSVSKTADNVVHVVESSSKEALEVLTSKSLWDEADNVRRERLGLPPLPKPEPKPEPPPPARPEPPKAVSAPAKEQIPRFRSKRATNTVIGLLAVLFAVAIFFTIRMYRTESASQISKGDYVPAPVETPSLPPVTRKPKEAATQQNTASTTQPAAIAPSDSLHFVLRATQPVWVSIAPDGLPAYRGELRAGETRTFRAGQKIVLNIGNQKAVEMQLDGQKLSNLPTVQNSNVVIRNLVLTRNHASLGGTALDWAKLTSAPPPPVPVPVPAPNPAPTKSSTPANAHAVPPAKGKAPMTKFSAGVKTPSTQNHGAKSPSISKSAVPKPKSAAFATSNQPKPKRTTSSSQTLHSVEPLPPGP